MIILKEKIELERLSPGFYAFSNNSRVVCLELIEYPNRPFKNEIRFNMAMLGENEEKIVVANEGSCGLGLLEALKGLRREYREIILRFAQEKFLKEEVVQKVA